MVKYDEVNRGGGASSKLDKKLLKSQKNVKKSKNLKTQKVAKIIGLEEPLPKYQSFVNSIQKTQAFVRNLIVFRAFFVKPRSFLDTTFTLIIDKVKLIRLLMLCHVFP